EKESALFCFGLYPAHSSTKIRNQARCSTRTYPQTGQDAQRSYSQSGFAHAPKLGIQGSFGPQLMNNFGATNKDEPLVGDFGASSVERFAPPCLCGESSPRTPLSCFFYLPSYRDNRIVSENVHRSKR